MFPQDACLVRDWVTSYREICRRWSQILLLSKGNVPRYSFNISTWRKRTEAGASPKASKRVWRQSCLLMSLLQWPYFSDYEMRHLLSLSRRRVDPWIRIGSKSGHIWRIWASPKPHILNPLAFQPFLGAHMEAVRANAHGLVTQAWTHTGSSPTRLTSYYKVSGTLVPTVPVYNFSRNLLPSKVLVTRSRKE